MRNRLLLLLGALAALVGGYLLYWYAQSPVGPGLYPARLGGSIVTTEHEPRVRLPIVWVRSHPWAERPPSFRSANLVGGQGDGPLAGGHWTPTLEWLDRSLPPWLRARAVRGYVELPFPREGFTLTGVRWQIEGEPERLYRTGSATLLWAGQEKGSISISGGMAQFGYPQEKPGQSFDTGEIEGYYLFIEGAGRVVEISLGVAGAKPPVEGLRYRPGREDGGTTRRFYEKEEYVPVSLPWEFAGSGTLYVPLTPEANARMRDTYYHYRPVLVVEEDGSRQLIPSGYSEYGLRVGLRAWRGWVPYFVYTAE